MGSFLIDALRWMVVGGVCALFSGCYSMSAVKLKHPADGAIVQCGPYSYVPENQFVAVETMKRCLDDYKGQGYLRLAK